MKKNGLFLGAIALGLTINTFGQAEKYVVIEEKTGTWCGYCPTGMIAMAELEEEEDHFIGIAVHNKRSGYDPMENSYYNSATNDLPGFTGFPYSCADRVVGEHAAYSRNSFNTRISEVPSAAIEVTGEVWGDKLKIIIKATFDMKVSGDWRLAAVVTENGVTGTSYGYAQVNYFSGGSPLSGAGHDWHIEPNPVPASNMVYDHVARAVADNKINGAEGSLPESCEEGSIHWYDYLIDLDEEWNVENLHVVGMLINPDGEIDNAGKGNVGFVGIEKNEVSTYSISAYPNPASDFVKLSLELEEAAIVNFEIVDMLGAVVYSQGVSTNLAAGNHINQIDLNDLSNGIYFVKTSINDKVEMTKIQVQK